MPIRRRTFIQATAGALALAPAVRAEPSAAEKALHEAAKKEGQLTWYTGILDQPLCVKVGQAFSQKYPGVAVNAIKTTSQVAFQRLLQDMKGGQVQSDVFTTTDVSHMAYLESKTLLIPYTPEASKSLVPSLQGIDPKGAYHVSWVGLVAIVYNTTKVSAADSPKDWPQLADPKWKNAIAFGSPNYSGMVGVWTVAMEHSYGWSYFEKLNKLNPLIGRSIDDAITVLNSGERIVAAGNPASALRSAAKGNPLAVNYPTSGTLAVYSPSAVIKGCSSPNAAKLFMEFLCGPEYSQILTDAAEQPLRPEIAPPQGAKSLADIKLIAPTLAEIEKALPGNKEKWKDTFS